VEENQAKKTTFIVGIRHPVQKLLDDYLTIGPFSPSETMQNDGKKSESAGWNGEKCKSLKNKV
jgi:hypothetical protein